MARNKHPEETIKLILDVSTALFVKNGYDGTTLQDIINGLGGLSKGAIYHHFKSKEEIFDAICENLSSDNIKLYEEIRDAKNLSGMEKLRLSFNAGVSLNHKDITVALVPTLLSDPKFVLNEMKVIGEFVAPEFVEPILRQGIYDGSIKAENPKEMAQAILFLSNLWLSPLVAKNDESNARNKCEVFNTLFQSMGGDILDEATILKYEYYCSWFKNKDN